MKKQSADKKPGVFLSLLETFITSYLITGRGLSENTKASYSTAFRLLIEYMIEQTGTAAEDLTFAMLDRNRMDSFLEWLETERGNSAETRNNRLAAIKSFASYAENHDFIAAAKFANSVRKIEDKRGPAMKRAFFTVPEVMILLDLPKLNTIAGRRDVTLLHLMFATAARAQEMCDLKVRDVFFMVDGRARVSITGKGRKNRKLIIHPDIARLLQKYIRFRGITAQPDAYIFCSQHHPQMSVSCVEEIFKKYVKIAKSEHPDLFLEKSYSPHSMRHSTAVSMLSAGVSLSAIQVFLGHENITTTTIYAEITQPSLEQTVLDWNKKFWGHLSEENAPDKAEERVPEKSNKTGVPDFLR